MQKAEPMKRQPSDGTQRLALTMIGSIALSVGGVVYACLTRNAADGGRGGALAVALTFFMLFMGRGTAEAALEAPILDPATRRSVDAGDLNPKHVAMQIVRVRSAVASMLDWQSKEKLYLTIASICGTLFWGFGDIVAAMLCRIGTH